MKHGNIALFVPHLGCPQQCSFCEQRIITGGQPSQSAPGPEDVWEAARTGARTLGERCGETEIAFFGGSFTAIDRAYMLELLSAAREAVERYGFRGIRCSTRPDAIDREVLDILAANRVTAVELGAQSMDDGVLAANRRGHTAKDTERAAELIRERGFELGLQMMTGLYTDTPQKSLATARRLISLRPRTARIYPTLVLPGTELERLYESGAYRPQTLEEAVVLCGELLDLFEAADVRVIRVGLHAGTDLEKKRLAGPYHPAFRQLVESRRFLSRLLPELSGPGAYAVAVNPREISTALGQGRENLNRLARKGCAVRFTQDPALPRGEFRVKKEAPSDGDGAPDQDKMAGTQG